MKRFLFVLLMLFLLFGLVACGSVETPNNSGSSSTGESVEQGGSSTENNSFGDLDLPMDEFD